MLIRLRRFFTSDDFDTVTHSYLEEVLKEEIVSGIGVADEDI